MGGTLVWRGEGIALGRFLCQPDDPTWRREVSIGAGHHVVLPKAAVQIAQSRKETFVADPTVAVLYDEDQVYRRRRVSPRGDHCTYVVLDDPASLGLPDTFSLGFVPVRSGLSTTLHAATATAHAEAVAGVQAELAADPAARISLPQLARGLDMSPAHLSRTFHRRTGSTIAAYRRRLRVLAAAERIIDGADDLAAVAFDTGFSSHSHLTRAFVADIGEPPSVLRRRTQQLLARRRGLAG